MKPLLEFTKEGIYCAKGKFHIDPWRKVDHAVITHAHADHARSGNGRYLAHHDSVPILKLRLGSGIDIHGVKYGESLSINGVKVSLHPAGHIPGAAQVRVEHKGEVWVVSGDYKMEDDGLTPPFEPVRCHTFITECTFGLPVYRWKDQHEVYRQIDQWWKKNREEGKISALVGYSLGKAQRLAFNMDHSAGPLYAHGAVYKINQRLKEHGLPLPDIKYLNEAVPKKDLKDALVIIPPAALGSPWMKKLNPYSLGIASGWMALRGPRRRRAADRGFILSDHADWKGLNTAIAESGAEKIITTHGYTSIFTPYLQEKGYNAVAESTLFEGELGEIKESAGKEEG